MTKTITRVLGLALMLLSSFAVAQAQEAQEMPLDPQVSFGVLDNGMTYYVRHNEMPKGQADFFIAQNVGSILEEDNQRGLAHFLEHMCFNGTTNFPGKQIINWLESKGVRFGADLNAYTSIEETVYNISNVPVASKSVQDSCLLILHDWACDLTLDPEEINAERGVIHEEWRRSMVGQMRLLENLAPKLYPGNRYGERLPIGTMEVVDNFEPQALTDYYHTWYRPDQQAIIVVGDIDPEYIVAKIKEIFSPIAMPANAKERTYLSVEDTDGTLYAIGSDKEMNAGIVSLMFKTDPLIPREAKNTQFYYPVDFMTDMMEAMLNARLSELAKDPSTDFAQASVDLGDYMFSSTKNALDLTVVSKGNNVLPGFVEAYRELLRATRGGFTPSEYERAKAEYLSRIEASYNSRNDRYNTSYAREYARHFTQREPAPGIEMEKMIYEQIAGMFPVDAINALLPQLVTENNRAFLAMMPDTYVIPTEEEVAAAMAAVEAETIEPYKDTMREDPLIPNLPAPGLVTSSVNLPQWDAMEFTLSNGAKVIVKKTEFKQDEIQMEAYALGGTSTLDQSQAASIKFLQYALARAKGLNDYSNMDIQKYLSGKQANVNFQPGTYTRTVSASSTVKDLPTLMELLYATFTGLNFKEADFEATQAAISAILNNQESTPDYAFSKMLYEALYQAPSQQALSTEDIKNASREQSQDIVRNFLANAADYTFVFSGNIDLATFVPLMEQYIATLPSDPATATKSIVTDPAFEPLLTGNDMSASMKMETPQTYVFIGIFAKMPYTPKNVLMTQFASQMYSKALLNKVREEMGATYSIGCYGHIGRTNEVNTMFQIYFPMKPEMKDEALAAIAEIMNNVDVTFTETELASYKEYAIKAANEKLEDNSEWIDGIVGAGINGVDTFNNTIETVNNISLEDVKNFAKEVLAQDCYRVIVLDPEVSAAE